MPNFRQIDENKWEVSALINETAARGTRMGTIPWENLFSFPMAGVEIRVIGLVKGLSQPVSALWHCTHDIGKLSQFALVSAVHLAPRRSGGANSPCWKACGSKFLPARPFEYQFFDEVLDAYYRSEINAAKGVWRFCRAVHFYQLLGNARIDRVCSTTAHQRDRHSQGTRCY